MRTHMWLSCHYIKTKDLLLLGSPDVLMVFVEIAVTNCDCALATVL